MSGYLRRIDEQTYLACRVFDLDTRSWTNAYIKIKNDGHEDGPLYYLEEDGRTLMGIRTYPEAAKGAIYALCVWYHQQKDPNEFETKDRETGRMVDRDFHFPATT